MKHRSWLGIKADAAVRKVMWHSLSGRLPLYLVAEYPKSGGTWFSQMLAEYLQVPYPQNRMPRIEPCVMHGHHLYSRSYKNVFCVVRDGRDALCSAYFHVLFEHGRQSPQMVTKMRKSVPFDNFEHVRENMPRFVEHMFTGLERGPFKFTWSEFVNDWIDRGVEIVKYEELLEGAGKRLHRAIGNVLGDEPDGARLREIENKYSFEKLARRGRGQEDQKSFLRKGVAGDWKEKFSRETREIFDHFAGRELIRMGYETDHSWVDGTEEDRGSGDAPAGSRAEGACGPTD